VNHAALLLASRQAYAIGPDGSVGESDGAGGVGWLTPPRAVVAGCNAALIGETPDGCVLAFRGTLPPADTGSLADWLEDLDASPVTDPAYAGLVHAGFRDGLAGLWPLLAPPPGPLFITGHSMGGALAQMAAYRLGPRSPVVVTFAAPRCGDATFAAALGIAAQVIRYENQGDIVPTVPPLAYRSAGFPRLIWHGALVSAYPNGWGAAVVRSLLAGEIIAAHTIGPGGGYATALGT
jgi:hypothetical protein